MWARSLFLPLSLSLTIIYADITLWVFLAICDLSCWSTTSVLNKEQTYSSKCWSLRIIAVLIEEAKGWCFCHHGSPVFWDKELSLQLLFWFSEGRCRGWGGVHPLHSGVLELVKQPGRVYSFFAIWTFLLLGQLCCHHLGPGHCSFCPGNVMASASVSLSLSTWDPL